MMSKMNKVFKRVLNDKEIFDSPCDKNTSSPIPKLFEGESWKELEKLFNKGRKDEFIEKIDSRIREIENQERRARGWRRDKINALKQRAEWLKSAFDDKAHLLRQLFKNLEWYGLVECYLPNMDDHGKVIERHNISTVEHYFVDKIKREVSYKHGQRYISKRGKALEKVLEYVKELYDSGLHPVEIAFFVRKLNSLVTYWEVIE